MVIVKEELLPQFLAPTMSNQPVSVSSSQTASTARGQPSQASSYTNSYIQYAPNLSALQQQQQQHPSQQQQMGLNQPQYSQMNLTSTQHQMIMDNSLHKSQHHQNQQQHISGSRSLPLSSSAIANQSIPLMASPSSNLVQASQQSQAQAQAQAAAVAAVNAAAADLDPDDSINDHDESGDITLHTTDGDGSHNDGGDSNTIDESTRRVNLSTTEKILLVKTFVEHEREFFDANIRNRDFWTMVNDRFSQLILRPFKTARQAIYRYVKNSRLEDREPGTRLHENSNEDGLSLSAPGSPGSRQQQDETFEKYVERAIIMFQQRKEMKEKRIRRSTSIAMSYGASEPYDHNENVLFGQASNLGNNGVGSSSSVARISASGTGMDDHVSSEYTGDDIERSTHSLNSGHQPHGPLSSSPSQLSKMSARSGDSSNLMSSSIVLLQDSGSASISTSSLGEKRSLNAADVYDSRKRYKLGNGTESEFKAQLLEKKVDSLYEGFRIQSQRFEEFTDLCTQLFTKISSKLDIEDPLLANFQKLITNTQRQRQRLQQAQSFQPQPQQLQVQTFQTPNQHQYTQAYQQLQQQAVAPQNQVTQAQALSDINSIIHPELIQQASRAGGQVNKSQRGDRNANQQTQSDEELNRTDNLETEDGRLSLHRANLRNSDNSTIDAVVAAARAAAESNHHQPFDQQNTETNGVQGGSIGQATRQPHAEHDNTNVGLDTNNDNQENMDVDDRMGLISHARGNDDESQVVEQNEVVHSLDDSNFDTDGHQIHHHVHNGNGLVGDD